MIVKRTFNLIGATGVLRTGQFEDREHLIVPITALVEGVIWPVNAEKPELVLAEELGKNLSSWNNRPVVTNHPDFNGQKVSANSPTVLDKMGFGRIFEAAATNRALTMEAWLDRVRAEKVEGAARVIERVQRHDPIELSVGSFLTLEDVSGVWKDGRGAEKPYHGIWRDISGDHLALLPEGFTGACSNEMGCGVRAASANILTSDGIIHVRSLPEESMPEDKKSLRQRLMSLLKFRDAVAEEDMSTRDLERSLNNALRAVEPGFLGVDSLFPAKNEVVYATMPKDEVLLYRRSYSMEDAEAKLGKEREQVQFVGSFEALGSNLRAACSCQGDDGMNKKERIAALISNKKTPWETADQAYLEGLTDERLKTLEQNAEEVSATPPQPPTPQPNPQPTPTPAPAPQPNPQPNPPAPEPRELTEDEMLARMPGVKKILDEHNARAAQEKNQLVDQLKTAAAKSYTEAELKEMPVEQLKKLAALVLAKAPIDFSTRAPRALEEAKKVPAPPSIAEKLRAARAK